MRICEQQALHFSFKITFCNLRSFFIKFFVMGHVLYSMFILFSISSILSSLISFLRGPIYTASWSQDQSICWKSEIFQNTHIIPDHLTVHMFHVICLVIYTSIGPLLFSHSNDHAISICNTVIHKESKSKQITPLTVYNVKNNQIKNEF